MTNAINNLSGVLPLKKSGYLRYRCLSNFNASIARWNAGSTPS